MVSGTHTRSPLSSKDKGPGTQALYQRPGSLGICSTRIHWAALTELCSVNTQLILITNLPKTSHKALRRSEPAWSGLEDQKAKKSYIVSSGVETRASEAESKRTPLLRLGVRPIYGVVSA